MTNKKVRFVANEKKKTENSPDYFVKSGRCDLGVAWNDVTEPQDDAEPLEYISVKLDGPEMTKPINAALFHVKTAQTLCGLVQRRSNYKGR